MTSRSSLIFFIKCLVFEIFEGAGTFGGLCTCNVCQFVLARTIIKMVPWIRATSYTRLQALIKSTYKTTNIDKHRIQFSCSSLAPLKIVPDLIESNFVVTHFPKGEGTCGENSNRNLIAREPASLVVIVPQDNLAAPPVWPFCILSRDNFNTPLSLSLSLYVFLRDTATIYFSNSTIKNLLDLSRNISWRSC